MSLLTSLTINGSCKSMRACEHFNGKNPQAPQCSLYHEDGIGGSRGESQHALGCHNGHQHPHEEVAPNVMALLHINISKR